MRCDLVERGAERIDDFLDQGVVNRLLRIEVVVEGPETDVRGLGDLVDRDALHAPLRHQLEGRPKESRAGLALAPRDARLRLRLVRSRRRCFRGTRWASGHVALRIARKRKN